MCEVGELLSTIDMFDQQINQVTSYMLDINHSIDIENNIYKTENVTYYVVANKMEEFLKHKSDILYLILILLSSDNLSEKNITTIKSNLDLLKERENEYIFKVEGEIYS